jgi:hypothetical protein
MVCAGLVCKLLYSLAYLLKGIAFIYRCQTNVGRNQRSRLSETRNFLLIESAFPYFSNYVYLDSQKTHGNRIYFPNQKLQNDKLEKANTINFI